SCDFHRARGCELRRQSAMESGSGRSRIQSSHLRRGPKMNASSTSSTSVRLVSVVLPSVVILFTSQQVAASCPPRSSEWELQGTSHAQGVGSSEARLGDVNGDSFDDLIVGAPGFNVNQGIALAFLGSANGLATTAFWTVLGEASSSFGQQVALAGD